MSFVCIGFLGLGGFFGAIRYALELVNPITTYIGTVFVVVVEIFIHFWLRRHPLPWVTQGQAIRVKRLGVGPVLGFAGACLLLWVPRLVSDSKTDAKTDIFRELALGSARKSLVSIHLRLGELYDAVEKIGTKNLGDDFRSLPDHLVHMGSLDISFCRSLESHVTDLNLNSCALQPLIAAPYPVSQKPNQMRGQPLNKTRARRICFNQPTTLKPNWLSRVR